MTHLTLEECNRLLSTGEESARLPLVEHLLDCPTCRARYQALRDLRQHFHPRPKRLVPRLALAAAALLLLGSGAWVLRQRPSFQGPQAPHQALSEGTRQVNFDLLDQVQRVNRHAVLPSWGSETTVLHLLTTDPG